MPGMIDYAVAGPLTGLTGRHDLPDSPVEICGLVRRLVIQPNDARELGLPERRFAENQLRAAQDIVGALLALDPSPLTTPRPPERRVVGTCRHFAVLACALLRHRGIAARARCGFATYFQAGQGLDHWVVEYWQDGRWVRIDPEIMKESLVVGEFFSGGEAWVAHREGRIDAASYGVYGTENWGPAEIRGNAVRDLAALNKVEMLPWDEWGRMDDSYQGKTGSEYDVLMDSIAAVCASEDRVAVADLYASQDLTVPAALIDGIA